MSGFNQNLMNINFNQLIDVEIFNLLLHSS